MKKARATGTGFEDSDTMRPEYDFSGAVRGVTAARYAAGTNVVVVDADVRDVFPTAASVNEALRALAPLLRGLRDQGARPTPRSSRLRPPKHSAKADSSPATDRAD